MWTCKFNRRSQNRNAERFGSILGRDLSGLAQIAMLAVALCICSLTALAIDHGHDLPPYDIRIAPGAPPALADSDMTARNAAMEDLKLEIEGSAVTFSDALGTPSYIRSTSRFLTGPTPDRNWRDTLAAFVDGHEALFMVDSSVLDSCRISRDYVTSHNGVHSITLQQTINGLDLVGAEIRASFTRNGELINVSSTLLPITGKVAEASKITPEDAIQAAAASIGIAEKVALTPRAGAQGDWTAFEKPAQLAGEPMARQAYFPLTRNNIRPVWITLIPEIGPGNVYEITVDAVDGTVFMRFNRTNYVSNEDASYRVYTTAAPSPAEGTMTRTLEVLKYLDATANPNGWMTDGTSITTGNNVDAYTDTNADDIPDAGSRPTGSPYRVFDYTLDLTQPPTAYVPASVTQLFYMNNWIHDRLYQLGFDEASGNFQEDNFGRGGLGSDPVDAQAQDGSGTNNANFLTPPDGSNPRMQMYIGTNPTPDIDGVFDTRVVIHEYVHGLSNRLVGVGSLNTNQQMGEGWSDFYGICFVAKASDNPADPHPVGTYLFGQPPNGPGIRPFPYSTNPAVNPHVFSSISSVAIPHGIGAVWCEILWVVRDKLLQKYGFAVGNELMLQLTTDGLKLTPGSPGFIDGRDAILQADLVNNGGANLCELWTGFAERGLGFSAFSASPNSTTVTDGFDVPSTACVTSTGVVQLNKNQYVCGDTVQVVVNDADLTGQGSLAIDITCTSGDVETILLSESPASSGSFTASIPISVGAVTQQNGQIDLDSGDTITATYNDADDGTGSPAVVTDTAPVVCLSSTLDVDFESGLEGFVIDNTVGAGNGLWHTSTACVSVDAGHTTPTTLYYGLDASCNYDAGSTEGAVLSPVLDLNTATQASLEFKYFLDTEGLPSSYDQAYVEVSEDGGAFTPIASNNVVGGVVPLLDPTTGWSTCTVDLTPYVGGTVQLRFRFRTGDSVGNTYPGFYVDDVVVLANFAEPCSPPLSPSSPTPANGATNVPLDTDLVWSGAGNPNCFVVPNANETTEGDVDNGWPFNLANFGVSSMRYQQIYAADQFPQSGLITQLRFRPDSTYGTAFPATDMTVQIHLGYAATSVGSPSETFASNIGATYTEVYNGTLTLSSANTGGTTRDFDIVVDVNDAFYYDPTNGPLLMDVRVFSAPVVTSQFDAAGYYAPQSVTTRIFSDPSSGDVNSPTGLIHSTGPGTPPLGLVTMVCFDGAVPVVSGLNAKATASIPYTLDPETGIAIPDITTRTPEEMAEIAGLAPDNNGGAASGPPSVGKYSLDTLLNEVGGTVEILAFNGYSDNNPGGEFENMMNAIALHFTDFNLTTTTTEDPGTLASLLADKHVFILPEQETSNAAYMATLGANWSTILADFVNAGGVVIVCDFTGFCSQCGNDFLNAAGLMSVGTSTGGFGLTMDVVASHPLTNGVSDPYDGLNGTNYYASVSGTTVVTDQTTGNPSVAIETIGNGSVVLIGHDFYEYNSDMARLIANAVQLANVGPCDVTYDVYFGTSPATMNPLCTDTPNTTCDPGILDPATTYYWQVVADNCCDTTDGPIWSFQTAAAEIPAIVVDQPIGGESWPRDTDQNILWTSTGPVGASVKIQLLKGGVVFDELAASTANDGAFQWHIPAAYQTGTDFKVRVTSIDSPAVFDESNGNFSITGCDPVISITEGPSVDRPTVDCAQGLDVQAHVLAVNSCGGPVTYEWSDTCGGSFDDATSGDPVWTAPFNDTGSPIVCTLTVVASATGATPVQSDVQVTVNPCLDCPIRVGDSVGAPGGQVTIPILVENTPNAVEAMGFDVTFDTDYLTFVDGDAGALTSAWEFLDFSLIGSGVVRVGGFTTSSPIAAGSTGQLVLLHFTVAATPPGETSDLCITNKEDDVATWLACCGTFQVGCCRDGDVNASCSVTPGDALLAFQAYLGQITLNTCEQYHADVNSPSDPPVVTPGDALCIFQFYLGQPSCIAEFPQSCSCQDAP